MIPISKVPRPFLVPLLLLGMGMAADAWCARTVSGSGGAAPILVADKDTVQGLDNPDWDHYREWKPANTVRLRNVSGHAVTIDSIRPRRDSLSFGAMGSPLELVFATRSREGMPVKDVIGEYSGPILIAPGDSVDLGLFEIGNMGFPVKQSAQARRYHADDSVVTPLTIRFGRDSLRIILKAKVKVFFYSNLRARPSAAPEEARRPRYGADGRRNPLRGRQAYARKAF
jgi:hypothetical protein